MAQVGLLKCAVRTPAKTYEFEAEVHCSEHPDEQVIDSAFYLKYAEKIHIGVHHELLLTKSPAYGRVHPEVPIHVYQHPITGKCFVCWIYQVEKVEAARELFEWWCVGTVYALEYKEDFTEIAGRHPYDFFEYMDANFCIKIVQS